MQICALTQSANIASRGSDAETTRGGHDEEARHANVFAAHAPKTVTVCRTNGDRRTPHVPGCSGFRFF